MTHRVIVIPGDGIGPEVVAAARRCADATGVQVEWESHEVTRLPLDQALVDAALNCGVVLKGPVAAAGGRSPNLALRDALGLELGVRPCRGRGYDLVVARMLAGDLYSGIEFQAGSPEAERLRELAPAISSDAGIALKPISRRAVTRAARSTFAWAREQGRRRVTIVHKATVMPATDGLFLAAARGVAADFPELSVDDRLIDAVCHDLVTAGRDFDVLFCPILYGDLLSDLCAGLTGGLGSAPGVNLGSRRALFEAVHGTAKRHAGRGTASPIALIRCAAMLLEHLDEKVAAARLHAASDAVLSAVAIGAVPRGTGPETDAVLAELSRSTVTE